MVNCWAETPFVFFLTFLFALPHVFRLGPGGLISFVYALVTNIQVWTSATVWQTMLRNNITD
jgi:hypothetical protein